MSAFNVKYEITRNDTNSSNDLRVSSWFFAALFFCLMSLIACQAPVQKETNIPAQDAKAKSELNRIGQIVNGGQPLAPQDFESLKQIRQKYPNAVEVRNVYQNALVKRDDWENLIKLINEIPAAERKREDNLNLAKSYVKLGLYREEIELLKPLVESNPQDIDYNSLLALGYFYLGQNEEAAKYLDAVWDALVQNKRSDEINVRGIIYFRQKNYASAIETFKKTLEINEYDIPANNTLSRVYAAQGNAEQAEIYRVKTENAQTLHSAKELKASRTVQNSYQLEDAWKAKRYEEVIALARQMIPDADDKNKPVLYQYMAESYKATGRNEEARKALAEAQNLKQK